MSVEEIFKRIYVTFFSILKDMGVSADEILLRKVKKKDELVLQLETSYDKKISDEILIRTMYLMDVARSILETKYDGIELYIKALENTRNAFKDVYKTDIKIVEIVE